MSSKIGLRDTVAGRRVIELAKSWVNKKYPRRVRLLLEFEDEYDFSLIDAVKGVTLGEALLNLIGEDSSLSDSVTLKVPETHRTVKITRTSKRRGIA